MSSTCFAISSRARSSIVGPTSVARLDGSPIRNSSMCPLNNSITRGAISSCRQSSRSAEHRWPALLNDDVIVSSTTCSGRAVVSTNIAFCPPVSAIIVAIGPSLAASAWLICLAVSIEPVIATPDTLGSAIACAPIVEPRPGRKCNTPPGTPASRSSCTARWAISVVDSAGLASTALPLAKAAATWPVKMANGKFHGLIQTKIPRPRMPN